MRLLVAEDDPRLLKTLTHIFESNKFSVDGVSNGEDALAHGQTVEYDGMVLDIMMPGMDGIEVLTRARAGGDNRARALPHRQGRGRGPRRRARRRGGRLSAEALRRERVPCEGARPCAAQRRLCALCPQLRRSGA